MKFCFYNRTTTLIVFIFLSLFGISQNYCIPPASVCTGVRIDSVGINTLANKSGCGPAGYTDYATSISAAQVTAGTFQTISVKVSSSTANQYVAVWIDFNQDNDFDAGYPRKIEFFDLGVGNSGAVLSKYIRIPFDAQLGNTRIRIRLSNYWGNIYESGSCSQIYDGETEDYLINILQNTTGATGFSNYVKTTGLSTNSGTSWADAYNTVSLALSNSRPGDTIRVGRGTYKEQINLIDSIIILGGYPNTGSPTDVNRNWGVNQTIISGATGTFNNPAYKIPNVINGEILSNKAIFDGFIVQDGYATLGGPYGTNPALASGMNLRLSNILVKNTIFRNNTNIDFIGVVIADGGSPVFENCFFVDNNSSATFYSKQNSNSKVSNCVFTGNTAKNIILTNSGISKITNCTFFKNYTNSGFNYPASVISGENNSNLNISNSILFNNFNNGSTDSLDFIFPFATVNITNTITQRYNTGNESLLSKNPKFKDSSTVKGPDNLYYTSDDGLQLVNPCSLAMNTGNNTTIAGINADILGKQRLFGTTVDLGAYEVQTAPFPIPTSIYVKASASGLNDGTSWANAYTDFQKAMLSCSDTIKVASGSYTTSYDNPKSWFYLENKRIILGGYPNSGNPTDSQRNPVLNQTILTGNLPVGGTTKSQVLLRGKNIDSTCIVDGVIVSDANNRYSNNAAILLTDKSSPLFRNIVLKNNISEISAAAAVIARFNCKPVFLNCTFDNNISYGIDVASTGAIYNFSNSNSRFTKCIFKNNSTAISNVSTSYGGVFKNDNSSPVFDSCIFQNNVSQNFGGCFYNIKNSNPVITNSQFYGNKANLATNAGGGGGSVFYNDASSPIVSNCLFTDSTTTGGGGLFIGNINKSNPTFTKCVFRVEKTGSSGNMCDNNNSSPTFQQCAFIRFKNDVSNAQAVISNINYSSPKLVNCISIGTQGGIQGSFMLNNKSNPYVINCTVINNTVPSNGSTATSAFISNSDSSRLTLQNSILWSSDTQNGGSRDIFEGIGIPSPSNVTNCILQDFGTNGNNSNMVGINPRLLNITDPDGPDNKYFTADDGYGLCSCSPVIDKGQSSFITGFPTDVFNNPRLFGSNVDIGAIEYQSPNINLSKTFYVKASAIGNNDGSSWSNAYPEFKSAILNPCADTIKVAKGIYKPSLLSRDSSFVINRGLVLYGGYPDGGPFLDSLRNPDLYPSILSGDIGVSGDSTDNNYTVLKIKCWDSTVVIDGITIERANGGGGVYASYNRNLLLNNCRLLNNYAYSGSALYSIGKITVNRCSFSKNNCYSGTFYPADQNAKISNCIFENNKGVLGTGIYAMKDISIENCIFYRNTGYKGAGVYLQDNIVARITNCNFVQNISRTDNYYGVIGIGLYSSNQYDYTNAVIRNCIFKENYFGTSLLTNDQSDWAWAKSNSQVSSTPLNLKNSATISYVNNTNTNIGPHLVTFNDITNPIGPDSIWFTADDGLQIINCSGGINMGDNTAVANIPFDITTKPRIKNAIVDMGAYEFQPSYTVLDIANDSLIANTEITSTNGWTSYYKDCRLLLSIKKGTQSNRIGNIGDVGFKVVIKTTPLYGSGTATNLSNGTYVSPGVTWNVLNTYWSITPKQPLTDSVLVRFPFSNTGFADIKGSAPSISSPQQIVFYKVDSPYSPISVSIPNNKFQQYLNGLVPTTQEWKYSMSDSLNYAEFFVKQFGGGSGGFGSGLNSGPFLVADTGCIGATRIFSASDTGNTYKWQINNGGGYVNINDNGNYSGTSTSALTITNPPSSWYGYNYRCVVNGIYGSYKVLKFQNVWTGNLSNSWENPGNWSCGTIPDQNTDVVINSGTVVLNSNIVIGSLKLMPGVSFTVGSGYTITITH